MTDKAFKAVLKWATIVLLVVIFFYSNLFDLFFGAVAAIAAVILGLFALHWFVQGERPRWKLSKKSK